MRRIESKCKMSEKKRELMWKRLKGCRDGVATMLKQRENKTLTCTVCDRMSKYVFCFVDFVVLFSRKRLNFASFCASFMEKRSNVSNPFSRKGKRSYFRLTGNHSVTICVMSGVCMSYTQKNIRMGGREEKKKEQISSSFILILPTFNSHSPLRRLPFHLFSCLITDSQHCPRSAPTASLPSPVPPPTLTP